MTGTELWEKYKPHIEISLKFIKSILELKGYAFGEVLELSCDDYKMAIFDEKNKLTIVIEMALSEDHDANPGGVNFSLEISNSTTIINERKLYNYTPECWVDRNDEEAVKERWLEFIHPDWKEFLSLLL